MATEIAPFEIIRRQVSPPGERARSVQGASAGGLRKALEDAAPDAVVCFALALPDGQTIMAGVQAVITDYDGSGACAVLCDANVARMMAEGMGVKR